MTHAWVWANGQELDETVKTVTLHEKTSIELQKYLSRESWSTEDQADMIIGESSIIKK